MALVSIVVEGPTDVPVVARILDSVGCSVLSVYGQSGATFIDDNIGRYNNAARFAPWLVLRDLDTEPCAAGLVARLLSQPALWMRFRIAKHEVEAWLLADGENLCDYLRVATKHLPINPEAVADPKQALVNLSRHSKKRAIVNDMVPEPGVSASVGPGYVSRVSEFARTYWRPAIARANSPSLDRCLTRAAELAAYGK
jgi:hypothetical protein